MFEYTWLMYRSPNIDFSFSYQWFDIRESNCLLLQNVAAKNNTDESSGSEINH